MEMRVGNCRFPRPMFSRGMERCSTCSRTRTTPSGRNRPTLFLSFCTRNNPGGLKPRAPAPHEPTSFRYTDYFMHYIYGINSVTEALKARGGNFEWVGMAKERHDIRLQRLIEDCRRLSVPVRFLQRAELDRMAGN